MRLLQPWSQRLQPPTPPHPFPRHAQTTLLAVVHLEEAEESFLTKKKRLPGEVDVTIVDSARAYLDAVTQAGAISAGLMEQMEKEAEAHTKAWEIGQEVKLRATREAWSRRTVLRTTQDIRRAMGHVSMVR